MNHTQDFKLLLLRYLPLSAYAPGAAAESPEPWGGWGHGGARALAVLTGLRRRGLAAQDPTDRRSRAGAPKGRNMASAQAPR